MLFDFSFLFYGRFFINQNYSITLGFISISVTSLYICFVSPVILLHFSLCMENLMLFLACYIRTQNIFILCISFSYNHASYMKLQWEVDKIFLLFLVSFSSSILFILFDFVWVLFCINLFSSILTRQPSKQSTDTPF